MIKVLKIISRCFQRPLGSFLFLLLFPISPLFADSPHITFSVDDTGQSSQKTEGVIHASPQSVWETLSPAQNWKTFMPHVPESIVLTQKGVDEIQSVSKEKNVNLADLIKIARANASSLNPQEGETWKGHVFLVVDTPFPVADRWFLLTLEANEKKRAESLFDLCWNMVVGNVKTTQGCFYIRPSPSGNPADTYLIRDEVSDVGGHVPKWVVSLGSKVTVPQMFKNIEKKSAARGISSTR